MLREPLLIPVKRTRTGQPTILIVEDDEAICTLISRVLRNAFPAAHLEVANDGKEGLHKAWDLQPDLIITDLSMPNMDGVDLVRALRRRSAAGDPWVPIIGLSGSGPNSTRTIAFRMLCDVFMTKPFELDEFRDKVRFLLADVGLHLS